MKLLTAFPSAAGAALGFERVPIYYDADVRTVGVKDHDQGKPASLLALDAWLSGTDPLWGGPNVWPGAPLVLGNIEESFRHDPGGMSYANWMYAAQALITRRLNCDHAPYMATSVGFGEPHTPSASNLFVAAHCRALTACCYLRWWLDGARAPQYAARSLAETARFGKPVYALVCTERVQAYIRADNGAVDYDHRGPCDSSDLKSVYSAIRAAGCAGVIFWNSANLNVHRRQLGFADAPAAWPGGPETMAELDREQAGIFEHARRCLVGR